MTFSRVDKDTARALPAGAFIYGGNAAENIDLIQSWQLKDASLWALLVEQFRNGFDNERRRWRSEYWGKMMRGAAMTYAYTLDDELYSVLEESVRDLLTVQDGQGRITSYDESHEFSGWDMWGRKYVLLGLQHFMEISKSAELNERITAAMMAHADYIIEKIGRGEGQIPLDDTSDHWLAMNSHTILEPMVRLYNLTGEKRYLDFSAYIVENGGIGGKENNIFELALEGKLAPFEYPTNKAYEMMSCFEGLIEYARVTGEEKWFRAAINFVDKVAATDITIIGCAGCTHELFDNSKFEQTNDEKTGIMQETCVTVTWMKICYQLLRLTGESKYAEHIERASYNGLLGSVNTERCTTNSGFHFDSYSPLIINTRGRFNGGYLPLTTADESEKAGAYFGCCTAIAAAGLALMPTYSVMATDGGILFNEYFGGSVNFFDKDGMQTCIKIETNYPYDKSVKMTVNTDAKGEFEIRLRIPSWSKNTNATLCGAPVEGKTAGNILIISRKWSDGDTVELEFDMRPRIVYPFGENNPGRDKYVAIEAGAIVLARDARLGGDISRPIEVKVDKEGYIENITLSKNEKFPSQLCYELDSFGEKIKLVDYSSAGKTWNEESLMSAWLPIK